MFWPRFLLISAATVCGAISPMGAQVATVPATITRNYIFPPVGLGVSETASITVVNTATASSASGGVTSTASDTAAPSDTTTTAPSCTGTISFSNTNATIGTVTPFTVGSDQFKTVALPFASAGLTGSSLANGNRGEIQGKVSLVTSTSTDAPCFLMLTMEIYDSTTGTTHAVLSSLASGEPVGPIPIRGGVTPGVPVVPSLAHGAR